MSRQRMSHRVTRTFLIGLWASAVLVLASCDGDKPAPGNQVDRITAATANIVFQARSVEFGFISTVDKEALSRDVDVLVEAAKEFDLDAPFRLPPPAAETKTTLRKLIKPALARLEESGSSPEAAERLRDAIDN